MRLRWVTGLIVGSSMAFAIALVNIILAASLHTKDLNEAKRDAVSQAQLIKSGILTTMIATGDYDEIDRIISEMKKSQSFEFRMVRAPHVIRQHGLKRGEAPRNELEKEVIETGEMREVMEDETTMRLIFPFITDTRCAACHLDMEGNPVKPGVVNGAAVLTFDLNERKSESLAVIVKSMMLLTTILILSGLTIVILAGRFINKPIRAITLAIHDLSEERFDISLPRFGVEEIEVVAQKIRLTAEGLGEKKREREELIEVQRRQSEEVAELIQKRAVDLGLADSSSGGAESLVGGLVRVMDEADRGALIQKAVKYLHRSGNEISLPTDPGLIPAVSVYLVSQLEGVTGKVARRSIELALEEALSNAIFHGNLELMSPKDEEAAHDFDDQVKERMVTAPYRDRKVVIQSESDIRSGAFTVTDEGKGFDWKAMLARKDGDDEKIFGRGLLIMRALAAKVIFNEEGNSVTMRFTFGPGSESEE